MFLLDCGSADLCFLLHTLPVSPKLSVTSQKKEACDVQNGVGWGEVEVMAAKRILELILEKNPPTRRLAYVLRPPEATSTPISSCAPEGISPSPTRQMGQLRPRLILWGSCSHTSGARRSGHTAIIDSSAVSWRR